MTAELRQAIEKYDALKKKHHEALKTLKQVQCKAGQDYVPVFVGGCKFDFATLDRQSGWMPYVMKGCEELQKAAEKIMFNYVKSIEGEMEGAQWKVKQLARELA